MHHDHKNEIVFGNIDNKLVDKIYCCFVGLSY